MAIKPPANNLTCYKMIFNQINSEKLVNSSLLDSLLISNKKYKKIPYVYIYFGQYMPKL